MSAKYTPGPWEVFVFEDHDGPPSCDDIFVQGVVADTWEWLAECKWSDHPFSRETAMANAGLIAAAPELLEALQALVAAKFKEWESFAEREAHEQAKAAIAKATGSAS